MKPIGSEITTSPKARHSGIGMPDGEHGSATRADLANPARLAASSPHQVNSSLASLARQCGLELRVSKDFKAKYDKHGAFIGYEETGMTLAKIDGAAEGIEEMRRRIDGAFAGPTQDQAEGWLAELSVIAPRRNDGEGNAALLLSAYISRLASYPADVVREALLVHTWRFWPSWAELHDVCEDLTAQRRAVRAALDRAAERALRARALPTQETARPTRDERAEDRRKTVASMADIIAGITANAQAERRRQADEDAEFEARRNAAPRGDVAAE